MCGRPAAFELAGVVDGTVAAVGKSVLAGSGMRWAAMGPTMLFNVGVGEGGSQSFFDHFSDMFFGW